MSCTIALNKHIAKYCIRTVDFTTITLVEELICNLDYLDRVYKKNSIDFLNGKRTDLYSCHNTSLKEERLLQGVDAGGENQVS